MSTVAHRHIPSMKAVRVQADCCIEKVVYEGDLTQIGIAGQLDRYNKKAGPLLCAYDLHLPPSLKKSIMQNASRFAIAWLPSRLTPGSFTPGLLLPEQVKTNRYIGAPDR